MNTWSRSIIKDKKMSTSKSQNMKQASFEQLWKKAAKARLESKFVDAFETYSQMVKDWPNSFEVLLYLGVQVRATTSHHK